MHANRVGNFTFIEGRMKKYVYLKLMQENLVQNAIKLKIEDDFRFYKDDDLTHKL